MGRLIIDGNSVYEIDEKCIQEKEKKERKRKEQEKQKKKQK